MTIPKRIKYGAIDAFKKDFKRLLKKFKTLEDDLETAKINAIELYHLKNIDNRSVFLIPNFCTDKIKICKLKKFACKSLKGRGVMSGIRIIYAFHAISFKVVFIEIYFKGEKKKEDFERIKNYLKNCSTVK